MQLKELITAIKDGDEKSIEWIYRSYREEFVAWAMKQYQAEEEVALDSFQEGVVSFYFNIKQDKISDTSASIKTYLFAISKNVLFNKLRKTKLEVTGEFDLADLEKEWVVDLFEVNDRQELLARALKNLGSNCQKLLKLFYFDNNSMEAIANKMGYNSEDVAKTQKMRCLKELRKIMKRN